MRRMSLVLGLLSILTASVLVGTPSAGATGVRYLDPVFGSYAVTSDIVYGQAVNTDGVLQDLTMDAYDATGDGEASRPAIVWIHGGSFVGGDKSQMGAHAAYTALRGYATFSINYRVRPDASWSGTGTLDVVNDPLFIQSVYQAYADTRTAVTYIRAHAAELRVDPLRIAVGGYSAGAVTALNGAVWPARNQGEGAPPDPGRVEAAISLAGTTGAGFSEYGEGPIWMAHGTSDPTVSYSEAQSFCTTAVSRGVSCSFNSYPATHNLSPYFSTIQPLYTQFLYDSIVHLVPRIDRLTPNTGPTTGGTVVTIDGEHFDGATGVTFGGVPAVGYTVESDTRIVATAPSHSPTIVNVLVTTPEGSSPASGRTYYGYTTPTTGAIGGTVTEDGSGTPLGGVDVRLYDGGTYLASTTTAADGTYTFPDLTPTTTYRVRFRDPGVHAEEFWPDAPTLWTGSPLTVTAGGTTTADAALAPVATVAAIGGTVTVNGAGTPLAGIAMTLYRNGAAERTVRTGNDGSWAMAGLEPTGSFALRARDTSGTHAEQWWQLGAGMSTATPIALTAGGTVTADLALTPTAQLPVLSGTVTGEDSGLPLSGIEVRAYLDGHSVAVTSTGAGGAYSFTTLLPASYQVRFVDPGGTYRYEFFDGAGSTTATPVILTVGGSATADASLRPA